MRTSNVSVVMPAYNEADGIAEFLAELELSLAGHDVRFVVVDDCSSDGTLEVLEGAAADGIPVHAVRNESNRGHGPSTLHALQQGLEHGSRVVVAVDGDGQFDGSDVAMAVKLLLEAGYDVVEGVRVARDEPWFRRLTASATRMLVRLRCGRKPRDANTPLRVYDADALARLLGAVPADAVTPNLVISALSRRWGLRILEHPVTHRRHRGSTVAGTTWRARRRNVPSARFVSFCLVAAWQWGSLRGSCGVSEQRRSVRSAAGRSALLLLPALVIGGCYAVMAYWVPIGVDSGVFMYCGRQVLDGLAPYADCWDHKGPLVYVFNALGLAFDGPRGVILLEGILLTASLAWATRVWAALTSTRTALLVGLAYAVTFLNLYEGGDLTESWLVGFSLVALTLFVRAAASGAGERERIQAALALGVAVGVALLTRPNNAASLAVAALVLVLTSPRRGRLVTAGAAAGALVLLPVLALVASRGALDAMWAQYIQANRTYSTVSMSERVVSVLTLAALLVLLPSALVILLVHVRRRLRPARGLQRWTLVTLAAGALLDLLAQSLSGRTYPHYVLVALPVLASYPIAVLLRADRPPQAVSSARGHRCLVATVAALVAVSLCLWPVRIQWRIVNTEADGLTNPRSDIATLARAVDSRTAPDDAVLVYGADTGLLVASQRKSAASITYLLPWIETGPMMREYVHQLRANPPRLIVQSPGEPSILRARCPRSGPCAPGARALDGLNAWIRSHYALTATIKRCDVWEPTRS